MPKKHKVVVLLLVLVLLVASEIGFRRYIERLVLTANFVFNPVRIVKLLDDYLTLLPKSQGPLIVFLGDSTTSMVSTKKPEETIQVLFEQEFAKFQQQATVYRLGSAGQCVYNHYFLLKRFEGSPVDLVLAPILYPTFNVRDDRKSIGLKPEYRFLEDLDLEGVEGLSFKQDGGAAVREGLDRLVRLYGDRDILAELLFGVPPQSLLRNNWSKSLQLIKQLVTGKKPPPRPALSETFKRNLRRAYGAVDLRTDPPLLAALQRFCRYCQALGYPVLFYFVPISEDFNRQLGLFDPDLMQTNLRIFQRTLETEGFNLFRIESLEAADFSDPHHIHPDGSRKVAEILARRADEMLRNPE